MFPLMLSSTVCWTNYKHVTVLYCTFRLGPAWITWRPSIPVGSSHHEDVIKRKPSPRYWPFVRRIDRSRWISRTKASDAELWCFFNLPLNNGWVNNREAGDLETLSCPLWVCLHCWVVIWVAGYCNPPLYCTVFGVCHGQDTYGLKVVFCFRHFTASHYHHYARVPTGVENFCKRL